jgi:hypothetical protein
MNGSSIVSMIDVYKSEWFFPALFALSASTEVFSTTMRTECAESGYPTSLQT